ncbi:MAG: hypothetical protein BLM47_11325 [Candidatus Reconcilbacillus cellulovorans]|uniref:ATP-grasp domain-containing protein n=1 Tax=Candidatus Reconcilbacillus cellulovorans TaxID=1906605 RepID=A0A2A6DX99_9BACL|nr:MAG: hypothetical protein BLM47_11325 [Candidatus Reconcilbacillus cellulovorans]
MARTKIRIFVSENADDDVAAGENVLRWIRPPTAPVTLRFGAFRHTVRLSAGEPADGLRLPSTTAARLGLQAGVRLLAHYRADTRTLALGPLIGVLINRAQPSDELRLFGAATGFCREFAEACRRYGACVFFFTPDELSTTTAVEGWSWNGRWRKSAFPIPDVVYNRLGSRRAENLPTVKNFLREARNRFGVAVFNARFLNKVELFAALKRDPRCAGYLPESAPCRDLATLRHFCSKYPTVFLKPVHGSQGRGIMRITRSRNEYVCETTLLAGVRRRSFPTLADLYQAISGTLKRRPYLAQQGLRLISADGRPIDMRVLVQRESDGRWSITSIVARIAGNRQFVSNLARGGVMCRLREALERSDLPTERRVETVARLRKAALDVARGVEQTISGHFAELGIDLGVEPNGRVWLIEVNSKPAKTVGTDAPSSPLRIRPSTHRTVRYAIRLAGF